MFRKFVEKHFYPHEVCPKTAAFNQELIAVRARIEARRMEEQKPFPVYPKHLLSFDQS